MGMPVEPKYSERLPYFDFHVAMPPVKPPRGRTDLICPVCGKGPVRLEPDYKATCEYCGADLYIALKATGESPKRDVDAFGPPGYAAREGGGQ